MIFDYDWYLKHKALYEKRNRRDHNRCVEIAQKEQQEGKVSDVEDREWVETTKRIKWMKQMKFKEANEDWINLTGKELPF